MYKRFIRWASDRLADNGIIAFITNRAYLEARQDDGFRQSGGRGSSPTFTIMDLGSDVRRNPKISGTTHNVFGIQTGRRRRPSSCGKSRKLGECNIHYAQPGGCRIGRQRQAGLSARGTGLDSVPFDEHQAGRQEQLA